MADVLADSLYDRDFYQWALEQARAVGALREAVARPGSNLPAALDALDWENLVEELEGLAKGVRSELRNRMVTIIEHLAKLELSPVSGPRRGWKETIRRSRLELEQLLDDNPSLRREVATFLNAPLMAKAAKLTVDDLIGAGERRRGTPVPVYTEAQILDDWWPGQQPSQQQGENTR